MESLIRRDSLCVPLPSDRGPAPETMSSQNDLQIVAVDDARWHALLARESHALFESSRWTQFIAEFYGFPAQAAVFVRDGMDCGGLVFAEVDDFRGVRRVAFPFSDHCDPIGSVEFNLLVRESQRTGIPWVVRTCTQAEGSLQIGVNQMIDLRGPRAYAPSCRGHVRHALRAGVTCRRDADPFSAIETFYPLYSELRRTRLRMLPQSRSFFAKLASRYFPDHGFALFADLNETVVAGLIALREGETLYVKYSATDYAKGSLGAMNLLLHECAEIASKDGLARLDLGLSTTPGLQTFKAALGAESHPVYQWTTGVKADSRSSDMAVVLGELAELLTAPDVPLSTAQAAGALLYRYFA